MSKERLKETNHLSLLLLPLSSVAEEERGDLPHAKRRRGAPRLAQILEVIITHLYAREY